MCAWMGQAREAEPLEASPQPLYLSVQDAERATWRYLQRVRTHAGMADAVGASTPAPEATGPWCPVALDQNARQTLSRSLWRRDSVLDGPSRSIRARALAGRGGTNRGSIPGSDDASWQHDVSASRIGDAAASEPHRVPLFPSTSDAFRQGFVRVINHGGRRGTVRVEAIDDAGERHGPVSLSVGADHVVHFNSDDLQRGNPGKGLVGGVGTTDGDWRLELTSDLDVEVLAYIRTRDGFLTAMHDVVERGDGHHRVAIFNPGSNRDQVSRLRLVNLDAAAAVVSIRGTDDAANVSETVRTTLPALASRTFTAADLEAGVPGLEGRLGDGDGKWRLGVESRQPVLVMNLLENPTGHLTNLSTAPANETGDAHTVAMFPAASDASRQGFVRIINHSDTGGEVQITAHDDSDWDYGPVTLTLDAGHTAHFNSEDLEHGNAAKRLSHGIGAGQGDWRLELVSELDIEVLAYVRTEEGFLTAMHDLAPSIGNRHRIAVFNPGSNIDQVSRLRLVNIGTETTQVTIGGIDGRGEPGDGEVTLAVPGGASRTVTAGELEAGGAELDGALGDGSGKWQLNVAADAPILVMNLLSSPTGHLTNLSTAPDRGANETAEEVFRVMISASVGQAKCVNCHVAGGESGHTRLVLVRASNPDHEALNLEAFRDFVAEVDDGAALILEKIRGVGHGGGVQVAAGSEDYASVERFLELLAMDASRSGLSPDRLFDGIALASPRYTLRRAALIFAGRLPTAAEYASVAGGDDATLRRAVRALMTGPAFHEFLLRATNDRLLTERHVDDQTIENRGHLVAFDNEYYRLHAEAVRTGRWQEFARWHQGVQHGAARAPLELVAHVVGNDRPFTEVLTANYVMANPWAASAYGTAPTFVDADDPDEFLPVKIAGYYTKRQGYQESFDPGIGLRVLNPGPGLVDHPHAGLLSTMVFVRRYPTTATNRNRARARWTYYHFLGVDVEKSASRTTDPVALADTDNPTMKNPACTVCHSVLDPVAGAFQNFGDVGFYRDQWGGLDSLDGLYKDPEGEKLAVEAGSWEQRETVTAPLTLALDSQVVLGFVNDYWVEGTGIDRNLRLHRLALHDTGGNVVDVVDLVDLFGQTCGEPVRTADASSDHWVIWSDCSVRVPVDVPAVGDYVVEVTTWADQAGDEPARLAVAASPYRLGDAWYRDMRAPGFGGESPPDAARSLPWLARRIVADERFAEAAVGFWWPAIMGRDLAVPPPESDDVDFDGRLLAARAQASTVDSLAAGLRTGFHDGSPYNVKDLLAEIVVSDWFRAQTFEGGDPVRAEALRQAGARRLLTPEELAHKTESITGFRWGRWIHPSARPFRRETDALSDLEGYRLIYGGIDSDGMTDRLREMNSVMAAVARSHAVESSCPIVLREFYGLPEEQRRLFGGIDAAVSPRSDIVGKFKVAATTRADADTLVLRGHLTAGERNISLAFPNDYWNADTLEDRNLRLDRLVVRDAADLEVASVEFEALDPGACAPPLADTEGDHLVVYRPCRLDVPVEIPAGGIHEVEVVAWADQAGDQLAVLDMAVESDTVNSAGARAIRNKLVDLIETVLGVEVDASSPDVEAAYRLYVDVWERRRETGGLQFLDSACAYGADIRYFDGVLEDALVEVVEDWGLYYRYDWERINGLLYRDAIPYDSSAAARAWVAVLAYLLMDYRYLYL